MPNTLATPTALDARITEFTAARDAASAADLRAYRQLANDLATANQAQRADLDSDDALLSGPSTDLVVHLEREAKRIAAWQRAITQALQVAEAREQDAQITAIRAEDAADVAEGQRLDGAYRAQGLAIVATLQAYRELSARMRGRRAQLEQLGGAEAVQGLPRKLPGETDHGALYGTRTASRPRTLSVVQLPDLAGPHPLWGDTPPGWSPAPEYVTPASDEPVVPRPTGVQGGVGMVHTAGVQP